MSHEFGPVDIKGLGVLRNSLVVAAGTTKTLEEVQTASGVGMITFGSITWEEKSGNAGRVRHLTPGFSQNSVGLKNTGVEHNLKLLPEAAQITHDNGGLLIVSVAAFSPEEYANTIYEVVNLGVVDGIEGNFSCPNGIGKDGKQKAIASYNADLMSEILGKIEEKVGDEIWLSAKLSPLEPGLLAQIAKIISSSKIVKAITTTNTLPNVLGFDEQGNTLIDPNNGLGGLSGKYMKPIGLGQVAQFRALLGPDFTIIGTGGIFTNKDAYDYELAGANIFGIATAYLLYGPQIFSQILHPEKTDI